LTTHLAKRLTVASLLLCSVGCDPQSRHDTAASGWDRTDGIQRVSGHHLIKARRSRRRI
jgi:hypothetical protein